MRTNFPFPVDALLLIGPTGSGKSPLGNHLERFGLFNKKSYHFDFGAELRSVVAQSDTSSLFSAADRSFLRRVLEDGLLLENEHFFLAEKILRRFLEHRSFRSFDLLILNGLPRHIGQLRDVTTLATVHALIVLDCSSDVVACRLESNIGGDRTCRSDDHDHLVRRKLRIFEERTAPLIRHFAEAERPVYRIPVAASTEATAVYEKLLLLASANPPIALVTEPPQR